MTEVFSILALVPSPVVVLVVLVVLAVWVERYRVGTEHRRRELPVKPPDPPRRRLPPQRSERRRIEW